MHTVESGRARAGTEFNKAFNPESGSVQEQPNQLGRVTAPAGHSSLCHGRAWPGQPRLCCWQQEKPWVAGLIPGSSPGTAMTQGFSAPLVEAVISHRPLSQPPRPHPMAENAPSAAADPGAHVTFMAGTEDHEVREPPPADREARALRGPPWVSLCLRVKSFLCRRPARLCPGYPGAPATPRQDTRAGHVSPTDTARQDQPNETTMRFVVYPNHQRSRLRRPHTPASVRSNPA